MEIYVSQNIYGHYIFSTQTTKYLADIVYVDFDEVYYCINCKRVSPAEFVSHKKAVGLIKKVCEDKNLADKLEKWFNRSLLGFSTRQLNDLQHSIGDHFNLQESGVA